MNEHLQATTAICIVFVLAALLSWIMPHDDTDGPDGRSALVIKIDARTGCEYLATLLGGPTPRLDHAGKQIGCRTP